MDTNFIIILIGVFFIMVIIKSMMCFKHEEDKKIKSLSKEKFDIQNPKVIQKPSSMCTKSKHSKKNEMGKVIDLEKRRKYAMRKKDKNNNKNLPIKNETLKINSAKKQWWI